MSQKLNHRECVGEDEVEDEYLSFLFCLQNQLEIISCYYSPLVMLSDFEKETLSDGVEFANQQHIFKIF